MSSPSTKCGPGSATGNHSAGECEWCDQKHADDAPPRCGKLYPGGSGLVGVQKPLVCRKAKGHDGSHATCLGYHPPSFDEWEWDEWDDDPGTPDGTDVPLGPPQRTFDELVQLLRVGGDDRLGHDRHGSVMRNTVADAIERAALSGLEDG